MEAKEFARILMSHGARGVYWVGGCVRDEILGLSPKDHDILVEGISGEAFRRLFPQAVLTGKKFPVYCLPVDGETMEIAFARRERKTGAGHCGYEVDASVDVTLEEDLFRRDLTMNAMARDILTGRLADPFHGMRDLGEGRIRAVSECFKEDALRALRAARQAAAYGFDIEEATVRMMRECREELALEPLERVVREMERALSAKKPSLYFRWLAKAGLLETVHPEIFRLMGQIQPKEYHPEGDAFEHSMMVLDRVAERTEDVKTRFAALFHDIGKGTTPKEELPRHHGHDLRGAEIVRGLPRQYKKEWKKAAAFAARHHMRVHAMRRKGKIVSLYEELRRNARLSMEEFRRIVEADRGLRGGNAPWFLDGKIMEAVLSSGNYALEGMSPEQKKKRVRQERIRILAGYEPKSAGEKRRGE